MRHLRLACCSLSWSFPHRLLAVLGTALHRIYCGTSKFSCSLNAGISLHRTNVPLLRPRVNWTQALGKVLGIVGMVLRRSSPHLGHFDGGDAPWAWTFDFLAQHLDLIARVADALWDLKALDGCEIDAVGPPVA
jgi:hypothetical protein